MESTEIFAKNLDEKDNLKHFRDEFLIPKSKNGQDIIYFCGNSLGLLSKKSKELIDEELQVWGTKGVEGHFSHPFNRPWVNIDQLTHESFSKLVGAAQKAEISVLNSLTVNLHLLLISFFRPTKRRFKIMFEANAFPSDIYAFKSQMEIHSIDPNEGLVMIHPRENEHYIRSEDIISKINEHGDSLAIILFSGVQYFTGQLFDIPLITAEGHKYGCIVGFDLCHAIGNVPLYLHDWNVDFACWCSYKYLNSGPGGISGIFLHENHFSVKKLNGWFSNKEETRFLMRPDLDEIVGADSFRHSNPCVLAVASLLGSLTIFDKTSMETLREKSVLMVEYLLFLLNSTWPSVKVRITNIILGDWNSVLDNHPL